MQGLVLVVLLSVTAVVILLTTLIQGITLPAVVRWAGRKREAATGLRNRNQIDDIVLRELLSELDLEEIRLQGADGNDED